MIRTTVLLTSMLIAVTAAADEVRHPIQAAIPKGQVQRVLIDIPAGEIEVVNGNSGRIALSGFVERDYQGNKEKVWAQKVVDDTTVEIQVKGAEAVVRRRFGPNANGFRERKFTTVELRIEVPAGMDVHFDTSFGEVSLDGIFGDVNVELSAGEIDFRSPRSQVRDLSASCRVGEVRANLGDEIVTREGVLPGKTKYFNANGKSHVRLHVTAGEVDVTLTK